MIRAGIDWGSTSFRAYRFDEAHRLVDQFEGPFGIKQIDPASPENYENTLFSSIGHWLSPGDSVLLSGMITSRSGWVETLYLQSPVDVRQITAVLDIRTIRDIELCFLPGICQQSPSADVMRGEELQLLGASLAQERAIVVMPGTHSKWAVVRNTAVQQFHTLMTGELFEALRQHTLVGDVAIGRDHHQSAFEQGVVRGFQSTTLVSDLFSLRSQVLVAGAAAASVHSSLSGLLIGHEFREAVELLAVEKTHEIILVANKHLSDLYMQAAAALGFNASCCENDASLAGFQQLLTSLTTTTGTES